MRRFQYLGLVLASAACASASGDPCECLNWKSLYAPVVKWPDPLPDSWPRLLCGEAREVFRDGGSDISMQYYAPFTMGFSYHEFCAAFYHKMDNNYCVNTQMSEYGTTGFDGAQWCVVSSECQELNGGMRIPDKKTFYHGPGGVLGFLKQFASWREFWNARVTQKTIPRDVSYKLCTKGKDKYLHDLNPEELLELVGRMDAVAGFVTKMAYPRLLPSGPEGKPGGKDWDHVKDLVAKGDVESMPKPLRDAINAGEPIVIDVDPNGHTHQKIIHGKKVYDLDQNCGVSGCGAAQWPFKRAKDMGEL
mmetsp:Transcript_55406/g.155904  ORF Transcript_55406/g.155904 Transcript_55406/m.155904 type:complete len:305 (+) Transcript_55406:86-1000(+)